MSSDDDDELSDLLGPLHPHDIDHEDCIITGKQFSLSREHGTRPGRETTDCASENQAYVTLF